MKRITVKIICLYIIVFMTACAGRLPSASRSTHLIRKYFNSYAKEYPESPFGKKKVTNVELLSTDEIHKHYVSVQAFVTMAQTDVHKIRITIEKGPFGWRTVCWENLSSQ